MDVSAKSRHRELWSAADLAQLELMISRKAHPKEIASQLERTEAAIRTKSGAIQRERNGPRPPGRDSKRRRNGASFFLS